MESELTFVAPEGVYSVTEEHKTAVTHPHLLAATPAIYPSRISTVVVRFLGPKPGGSQGLSQLLGGGKENKTREKERDKERDKEKEILKEDGRSFSSSENAVDDEDLASPELPSSPLQSPLSPSISYDPPKLFAPSPSTSGKKKSVSRPKHNIRNTSSTFVTRLQSPEGVIKTLQAKQGDVTFMFFNCARSFFWMEAGSQAKEPLARVTFSAYPTCHDVNMSTASPDRLDIVIGFHTGDLIWFDPMSSRYVRLNKQGRITNSPCTAVRWVPLSPTLFLVSHADGTIVVYDKERDDGAFTAPGPSSQPHGASPHSEGGSNTSIPSDDTNSQGEWNPMENIFVTMPRWHPITAHNHATNGNKSEKDKTTKNPVSHWRVSRGSILDFAFSPDVKYVATVSDDGCLRVIDALSEQLVDCYASYFGSLTCVAWSPDGRLILTGGQDDLVTIFSPWEQRVIARCQGHSSFVSAVAFDDLRCDGRTYRFGTVGEDNRLILWDFSSGAIHRPKLNVPHQQRVSASSTYSLAVRRRDSTADGSTLHLASGGPPGQLSRYHPSPSRNEIAVVQPVLIKHVEGELLTAVAFTPTALLTVAKTGHLKLWVRPLSLRTQRLKNDRGKAGDRLT